MMRAWAVVQEESVERGHNRGKGVFTQYLDKSVRLHVNLKSTSH